MTSNPATLLPDGSSEILMQLENLRQRTQDTGEDLRRMEQEQEAFALEYHELTKIQANLAHLQSQPQSQQRQDFEKQFRLKKDMSEQKLNIKVTKNSTTKILVKLLMLSCTYITHSFDRLSPIICYFLYLNCLKDSL